jgi:hypothetical protein
MRIEQMNRRRNAKRRRKLFPLPKRSVVPASPFQLRGSDGVPLAPAAVSRPARTLRQSQQVAEILN